MVALVSHVLSPVDQALASAALRLSLEVDLASELLEVCGFQSLAAVLVTGMSVAVVHVSPELA